MIAFEDVVKRYGPGPYALNGLTLSIAEGEFVALLGTSGAGKTTALKLVNRLLEPTSGSVSVAGQAVKSVPAIALRRSIGYVFQRFGLFPHLTVAANVSVVPQLLGWSKQETADRTTELLLAVGLSPKEHAARYPEQLSGGQQQRVGLARALAARPKVMLLDEPFGALDPHTRDRLQGEYRSLHDKLGLTTLLVTHDVSSALLLADKLAVIDGGRVVQEGAPGALLKSPCHEAVAQLFERTRSQLLALGAVASPGHSEPA